MKTNNKILREKAATYGLKALNDAELIEMLKYKGTNEEFFNSQEFKAMKELVRREGAKDLKKISRSSDAFELLKFLADLDHEQFWCIYLNRANQVQKVEFVSKGGTTGTVVDVQVILKEAILLKSNGIILAHNHPSGNLRPSDADVKITSKIKEAAKFIDVQIYDHVIIGGNLQGYYSFADECIL